MIGGKFWQSRMEERLSFLIRKRIYEWNEEFIVRLPTAGCHPLDMTKHLVYIFVYIPSNPPCDIQYWKKTCISCISGEILLFGSSFTPHVLLVTYHVAKFYWLSSHQATHLSPVIISWPALTAQFASGVFEPAAGGGFHMISPCFTMFLASMAQLFFPIKAFTGASNVPETFALGTDRLGPGSWAPVAVVDWSFWNWETPNSNGYDIWYGGFLKWGYPKTGKSESKNWWFGGTVF